ncbi:carboxypeptidase regulatory-like domain-containing protein [Prevotella dentasini]|uniref:carboxypeptidase regulatory-like domain-containing protein n=1 Tax=Prevotella dentasini TaxID=589537 RepID=UPI000468F580|nr:carboxypeptidase regulatory-like domain-containing protein [Prevotella dentasini]
MKHFLLLLTVFFSTLSLHAQTEVTGTVVDSLSGAAVAKATVMLTHGGKTITFARTNDKGGFRLTLPGTYRLADVELQATSMGYAKKRQRIGRAAGNRIGLSQKTFEMKEVTVKAGPVTGRKDTITFDLTRYASERDNSLKDVLKKLPGVEVAKNGQISVNGKALSRFTVEGLDLSDGKYNKLTENIKAQDVKKAEVIEHDQPVKALRNKVYSDNVAMNVVLKDSARDQLSYTLRPHLLVGKPTHVGGNVNVMQIGKRKQMMYDIAYDRSGQDVNQNNQRFYFDFGAPQAASLPNWYSVAGLSAPIREERLRFNTSQSYSLNHLTKGRNDAEVRLVASYLRNVVRQTTTNRSVYHFADMPARTEESKRMTLREDAFEMSYNRKLNNDDNFGSLKFSIDAAQSDALSQLNSTGHEATTQQVRNPELNLSGSINKTYTTRRGTMSWGSILDYHHSRNDLYLNEARQSLNNNLWHTEHSLSWNVKRRYWTQNYYTALGTEALHVQHNDAKLFLQFHPSWMYERGRLRLSFFQSINLQRYTHLGKWNLLLSPNFYTEFKASNRSESRLTVGYSESGNSLSQFALEKHQTDYRSFSISPDFLPEYRTLYVNLGHSYKRLTKEFFINWKLNASRMWSNSVVDMQVLNGDYFFAYQQHNTHSDNVSLSATVSKGFYDLHLKTSLGVGGAYSRGDQYSQGSVIGYSYRQLSFNPTVSFAPSWMQADYEGTFTLGNSHSGSTSMPTLFNWVQRLTLTSTIRKVDLSVSGVYYHNELQASPSVNTFLADARLTWRLRRVRLSASLRNLLNKRVYATTTYSGVGVFTNEYELRPRELMVEMQFSL